MKLASYNDGSRDGHLVVVSHDGATAHYASGIASRLQQLLDDWNFLSPQLEDLSTTLNHGRARHAFAFDARLCLAPLPRAYQRVGMADAEASRTRPDGDAADIGLALLQRGSDGLLGPFDGFDGFGAFDAGGASDPAAAAASAGSAGCGAGLAVVTGDVPRGASPDRALEGVRLLMLSDEGAPGVQHAQAAFAPLAVTPDELGGAWRGGRMRLPLTCACPAAAMSAAAPAMRWHFGELIAALAARRPISAGSIVGSGPLCGATTAVAASSVATAAGTKPRKATAHSSAGIHVVGADGHSVFGSIEPASRR